jgi:hypothetical protein
MVVLKASVKTVADVLNLLKTIDLNPTFTGNKFRLSSGTPPSKIRGTLSKDGKIIIHHCGGDRRKMNLLKLKNLR